MTYALEDPVGRVAGNSVPAQVLSVVLPLPLSTSRRTLQTVLRCPSDASASLTGTGIRLGQVWSAANPAVLGTKAPALTSSRAGLAEADQVTAVQKQLGGEVRDGSHLALLDEVVLLARAVGRLEHHADLVRLGGQAALDTGGGADLPSTFGKVMGSPWCRVSSHSLDTRCGARPEPTSVRSSNSSFLSTSYDVPLASTM